MALSAIAKFLSYGLIDPSAITAASAVEQIADAVTHARFVGTDPGSDEVVLLKILQVLRTLLLTPVGSLLTNESVCEVLQSCFRICFETRLSELLRRACEYTLMDMIQLLFTRLPTFQEDPRDPYVRKLAMRTRTQAHAGHGKRRKQYKHRKKQQNIPSGPTTPDQSTDAHLSVPPASTPDQERQIPTPEPIKNRVESSESLADASSNKAEDSTGQSNVVDVHGNHLVANILTCDADSNANSDAEATDLRHSASVASQLSQPNEDSGQKVETPTEEIEPERMVGDEEVEETVPHREQDEDDSPQLGRRRLVNQRGVTFTSDDRSSNGPLVPYGLPCIRELFRFLISLIDPYDRQNSDQMIQMGLNLLTVALEAGADYIGNYSLLMPFVKNELCRNFLRLLSTEKMGVFAATLRACFLLFEALRTHMKLQLEQYLQKLMQIVDSENPKIQFEQRETALEALVQLWRIPGLVTELYLNYDCDLYCTNLFEDVTKLLSKNSFPVAGIYSTHLLSLDALLTVVETIEANCQYRMIHDKNSQKNLESGDSGGTGRSDAHYLPPASGYAVGRRLIGGQSSQLHLDEFLGYVPHLRQNRMPVTENLPGFEELIAKKSRKRLLATGTDLFNQSASKGILFLQEHKLLHDPLIPEEIVAWIRENPRLDKRMIGDYISNRKHSAILDAFVRSFNFKDTRLDDALRLFLESFRLPGEAPLVSMIMEHFADHWHKANDEPFGDTDAAFTLSYAIIMLNTDQHNPMARR